MARPSCLRLFWHLALLAASRTFWTAGNNRPIKTAMMAITTNSSISVKATRRERVMGPPPAGVLLLGRDIENEVVVILGDPRGHVGRILVGVPIRQHLTRVVLLLLEVGNDLAGGDGPGKRHLVVARLDALVRRGPH